MLIRLVTLLLAGSTLLAPVRSLADLAWDTPADTHVPQTVTLSGATIGASVVHVWAWPQGQAPIFLGAAVPNHADPLRQMDTGWSLTARNLPVGTYPIVAYALDQTTGQFDAQIVRTFTVRPCNTVAACFPFIGSGGALHFWYISVCQ